MVYLISECAAPKNQNHLECAARDCNLTPLKHRRHFGLLFREIQVTGLLHFQFPLWIQSAADMSHPNLLDSGRRTPKCMPLSNVRARASSKGV